MRDESDAAFSIAEGLLPLLDISVLLLGLFIVLFSCGAFSGRKDDASDQPVQLPGIGQVVLVEVRAGGGIRILRREVEHALKTKLGASRPGAIRLCRGYGAQTCAGTERRSVRKERDAPAKREVAGMPRLCW